MGLQPAYTGCKLRTRGAAQAAYTGAVWVHGAAARGACGYSDGGAHREREAGEVGRRPGRGRLEGGSHLEERVEREASEAQPPDADPDDRPVHLRGMKVE